METDAHAAMVARVADAIIRAPVVLKMQIDGAEHRVDALVSQGMATELACRAIAEVTALRLTTEAVALRSCEAAARG